MNNFQRMVIAVFMAMAIGLLAIFALAISMIISGGE